MKFFFSFYFFFILLKIIKLNKITIPFKAQNYDINKNSKYPNIINNYLYKDIVVNISIGNPPQNIQLSPCLGEYTTFVISKDADGYKGGTYEKNLSSSYISLLQEDKPEFFTFQTFSEGIQSKEIFTIENGQTKINDFEFILATEIGGNNCYSNYCEVLTQPGILGLEILQLPNQIYENVSNTNFITQLKKKNIISDYYFNFHFNDENSGNLIIGLKPDEYDRINYKNKKYNLLKTTSPNDEYLDWSIFFDKIYYGNMELVNEKPIILRIEFGLIIGYYEWEKILLKEFFNDLMSQDKCFKNSTNELGSTAHYYYCDKSINITKFKPISFTINEYNYNFILDKDDLFIKVGDIYLFLMIFGGIYDLILGYPFLKKYQIIFNQDSKTIGFYQDWDNRDKFSFSNISYYIVIFILLIILLILISIWINLYKKRNKTKKNATELSNEEYDYNNHKNDLFGGENLIN